MARLPPRPSDRPSDQPSDRAARIGRRPMIESISAITLATHDMPRAVRFYRMLGFEVIYGGDEAAFTSFRAGTSYLNLIAQPAERTWSWWGRVVPRQRSRCSLRPRGTAPAPDDHRPRTLCPLLEVPAQTLVWLPSPSPTQAACWYSGPRFFMGEPPSRWCPPRRSVSKFHQPWDDR